MTKVFFLLLVFFYAAYSEAQSQVYPNYMVIMYDDYDRCAQMVCEFIPVNTSDRYCLRFEEDVILIRAETIPIETFISLTCISAVHGNPADKDTNPRVGREN